MMSMGHSMVLALECTVCKTFMDSERTVHGQGSAMAWLNLGVCPSCKCTLINTSSERVAEVLEAWLVFKELRASA